MEYKIYKMDFSTGVHFGSKNLEDAEYVISADTLFSAVCQEYLKIDASNFSEFVNKVCKGDILFSNTFPYIENELYLPKPMMIIDKSEKNGDSTVKKAYKKLNYIPISKFEDYINGKLDVLYETNKLHTLGKKEARINANVCGEETLPYRTGIYHYNENCGLYFIVGYKNEEDTYDLNDVIDSLGYSGIGGKRNSGLGKFSIKIEKISDAIAERFDTDNYDKFMTLSVCLPKDDELPIALDKADYKLDKRSGFVYSENYSSVQMKKKDLYVFQAGSCFASLFDGDVYDVSKYGNHAVYRYAKPMFMGV